MTSHVQRILTINSGSSSIKFALFSVGHSDAPLLAGQLARIGLSGGTFRATGEGGGVVVDRQVELPDHDAAFRILVEWLKTQPQAQGLDALGHRIVHGGTAYMQPTLIDPALIAALEELAPLAPNHLPHEILGMNAARRAYPEIPHVACFDTAFHRHMPREAQTYALPQELRDAGVVRYGFHGLSYEYILGELRKVSPESAEGRVIISHLGNGASLASVRRGIGIDTTMGMTPTGGLVMGTRSGDLDPGVMLYLLKRPGMNADRLDELVNRQSGILGLSGSSSDVKDLLEKEHSDPRAAEALAVFCYQVKKFLAALAATLGGLETLIFTAGIGERAPAIRQRICSDLGFLGIQVDRARNDANAPVISPEGSAVTVRVMKTNEELMIARHTGSLLQETACLTK